MQTTIYMIRHGDSIGNQKRDFLGHTDLPITEKGEKQALSAAKYLASIGFRPDAVYASPLCRAAKKSITTGWWYLVAANIVFIITIVLSSVLPTRLESFADEKVIAFVFLSASIMAVYPIIFKSINIAEFTAIIGKQHRENIRKRKAPNRLAFIFHENGR